MTYALRWAMMRAILMLHNCEGQSFGDFACFHVALRPRRRDGVLGTGLGDSRWIHLY